jgi:transketolase
MRYSREHAGPMFLRMSRLPVPDVMPAEYDFELGVAQLLRAGDDVTLMANGVLVEQACAAAKTLAAEGISARVLNMSSVKPIDVEAVLDAARTTKGIVTVEEASDLGGLGGAVAEIVVQQHPVKMRILGVPGVFAPTGSEEFLLNHFGLNAAGIHQAALDVLRGK